MAYNKLDKGKNGDDKKESYEKLVGLCPFAVLILKDGVIQFSNKEGLKLFHLNNMEQIVGKRLDDFLNSYSKDQKYCLQGYDKTINLTEHNIVHSNGTESNVEIMSIPVNFDAEITQLIILRDLTFQKLAEQLGKDNEQVKRLLEKIRAMDEMKNDYVSNLSHELRTPLNVIMSTIQLMESILKNAPKGEIHQNLKKYIGIMKQNCFRQLRLINNIIDIGKIDSGFYEINKRNYDIVNIVENITLSVSEYIKSKSINLVFDTDMEEKIIACDVDKIERIMLNLLSNAVKFTAEGGSITVNMYDKGDTVVISVKDSGIGIPKEKLDIIFERFKQVDKSLTRSHEGSGIGLSLVKSLVEMHEGRISVKSEYGKGSEFIVELPVKTVQETDVEEKEERKQDTFVEKINLEFSDIYKFN